MWTSDAYNPYAMESGDDNLMNVVLASTSFPFLDDLRTSTRLWSFEEILMSIVDEDEDYRRLTEQEMRSTLHLESLGLILLGQPISVLADLSAEFEEAG